MILSGISKSYAGVQALADVSLEVQAGQIHALLGENGAGKSTLMAVASGSTRPDTGTSTFQGQPVTHLTPAVAIQLGIAIVHQHPALLPDMSVAENLRVAVPAHFLRFAGDEESSMRRLLDGVGSSAHLKDRVNSLGVAQRHLLELAKALAIMPKLLILDEPTAPLGQDAVDLLFDRVRSAAREGTAGDGFAAISMSADRGEIVGVAGVAGNGQSAFLRALAGLAPFTGNVQIGEKRYSSADLLGHSAYMPADRHVEGLMMTLSVRENSAVSSLTRFRRGLMLSRGAEVDAVNGQLDALAVRAPSIESTVSSLSGGNQQKVVLARAVLAEQSIVVADEPTQGVDVGARAEIYRILREVCDSGVPVVVASSDAKELEGLCDRVIVMSRGHVVECLSGNEITEERMINAAVRSTTHSRQDLELG